MKPFYINNDNRSTCTSKLEEIAVVEANTFFHQLSVELLNAINSKQHDTCAPFSVFSIFFSISL